MMECMLSAGKSKGGKKELGYTCKIPLSKLTSHSKLANYLRSTEKEVGIKHQFYSQGTLYRKMKPMEKRFLHHQQHTRSLTLS